MPPRSIFNLVKILPASLLLITCRAALVPTAANKTSHLDTTVVALVCNQPYRFEMPEHEPPTILSLFQIKDTVADTVSVQFDDPKTLRLTYRDSMATTQKTFAGHFTKKGFKIVFSNKRKGLPTYIPLFYGEYDVHHITLGLTADNNLVIKKIWNRSGHFFIIGFSDAGSRKSYFTVVKSQ